MTKEELQRKVNQQLSDRRQRAQALAHQRKQQAYDCLPQLLELDNLKITTGIEMGRLAATGASAAQLEKEKQKLSQLASQRAELLASQGWPADYLEPHYHCTICQDTGRANGKQCSCARQLGQQLRREEINARFPLELCRFENFRLDVYPELPDPQLRVSPRAQMQLVLKRCREYAETFTPSSPSLYLFGETGIGKTHLALSIAGNALKKGFHVVYTSSQNLFFELQRDKEQAPDLLETLLEADLLVLDDLGTELVNAYVISTLYNLVDTRLGRRRATIYTTNIIDPAMLEGRYTEKIASRLLGGCEMLRLLGNDLRIEQP